MLQYRNLANLTLQDELVWSVVFIKSESPYLHLPYGCEAFNVIDKKEEETS
jgi:hypothetical protein